MRFIYLHGFASKPASRKATHFRERFTDLGIDLSIPALDGGDFFNLTVTGQLGVVAKAAGNETVTLIGSSLGGYLAALYAARNPGVDRIVLLAPAFCFPRRWEYELGAEVFSQWRKRGRRTVFHYGAGSEREISFRLIEDGLQYEDYPKVPCPALLLHGRNDDVVPIDYSREFLLRHPGSARLAEFDSNHELGDVLTELWDEAREFLFERSQFLSQKT